MPDGSRGGRPNRRLVQREAFYEALRVSLRDLVARGSGVTQSSVIANARFLNGNPVGKTTLYRKGKAGEYVHAEFMKELGGLIKAANKPLHRSKKAPVRSEVLARVRAEKRELELENDSLLAQFAELVDGQKARSTSYDENRSKTLEADLYVVASLLSRRIGGCLKEVEGSIGRFEMKYSGQSKLLAARERVDNLELRILGQQVTSIFNGTGDEK